MDAPIAQKFASGDIAQSFKTGDSSANPRSRIESAEIADDQRDTRIAIATTTPRAKQKDSM